MMQTGVSGGRLHRGVRGDDYGGYFPSIKDHTPTAGHDGVDASLQQVLVRVKYSVWRNPRG